MGLTRPKIIAAAMVLIDRDGLEAFSIRKLAADLGVDPMSLYNHVANKDDLFDGIVEHVFLEMTTATGTPAGAWEDQVRQGARAFRRALLSHPQASILVLTRRVLSDVPLGAFRAGIAALVDAGLSPEQAVLALRTLTAFLSGTVLRELGAGMTFAAVDAERTARRVDEISGSGDPLLAGVAPGIALIDHDAVFELGVELFISGIAGSLLSGD